MDVQVKTVPATEREMVEIRCHQVNDSIDEIVTFIKSRQGSLSGNLEGDTYEIPITDVLYIESVDNRTFLYTQDEAYESRQRIYELEDVLKQRHFIRISKSSIVNLLKIQSIRPALNGRFSAILCNGEEIIISRKYVSEFKKTLKGA